MKKIILASLAVLALASCEKESTVDMSLSTKPNAMVFAPYAGASVSRGTAVSTNAFFASVNKSFKVAAYSGTDTYFGFNTVSHNGSAWTNIENMYWPNVDSELHFGAFSPADAGFTNTDFTYSESGTPVVKSHSLKFSYSVADLIGDQKDIMYSISDYDYTAPAGTDDADASNEVDLHFKHALTQVAFTATKAADLKVAVRSIKICNVMKEGDFEATAPTNIKVVGGSDVSIDADQPSGDVRLDNFGSWSNQSTYQNYAYIMDGSATSITVNDTKTTITDDENVMMLMPQALTAWDPKNGTNTTGAYLAIVCKITHDDGDAPIVDGTIYVPFDTKDIPYIAASPEDVWKPGYKITYNLHFGGGYTIPGEPTPTDPIPGETPDPDEVVPTLRAIKYSITVDDWVPVNGGTVDM